jgi:propionyl-CoA carboxylase alpha chain
LQVEHTVTEEVTGLDLVALQLDVAAGGVLPIAQSDVTFTGHAIQARICAEDPHAGWLPSTGYVRRYQHSVGDDVRYEDGIASGVTVSQHYDSMITKVIAKGASRADAINALGNALAGLQLHGLATNIVALSAILADADYQRGDVTVNWLEQRGDLAAAKPLTAHAVAAAVAASVGTGLSGFALSAAWSNTPRPPVQWSIVDDHGGTYELSYQPPSNVGMVFPLFQLDGADVSVRVLAGDGDRWRVEVDGMARVLRVSSDGTLGGDAGALVWINGAAGQQSFTIAPRFADRSIDGIVGGPTSPMPGTVQSVHVTIGQVVTAGDRLVVVEAMKMEHVIRASGDAVVAKVLVDAGQAVTAGKVLVELEELR